MIKPLITGKGRTENDDITLEYYNVEGLRFVRMTWRNRKSDHSIIRVFRLASENYMEGE